MGGSFYWRAMNQKDIDRFWSKVDRRGMNECWEWQGARRYIGYGGFWLDGKNPLAHRIAYELCFGLIPEGFFVCHSCDNPPCCNPRHLHLGTHQDNMDEMVKRKRAAHGERNGSCKLSDVQVAEIRRRHSEDHTSYRKLAKEYGVSNVQISNIVNYRKRT